MESLDQETLKSLELFRRAVELGIATEEEFERKKKACEAHAQCEAILRELEGKYGPRDASDKDKG